MRKLAVGLMLAAVFAFVSYNSFANCGKCGHGETKCATQAGQPACKTMADKPGCGMNKPCGCCEKCTKGECSMTSDGKPCCDKCVKGCCMKSDDKPCCDKCSKDSCSMADGKHCCDKCAKGCCKCCSAEKPCKMKSKADDDAALDFAPDPVCGMDVTIKDAKHTFEHEGKTYYFCCESCKERFSKDPSKFLGQ